MPAAHELGEETKRGGEGHDLSSAQLEHQAESCEEPREGKRKSTQVGGEGWGEGRKDRSEPNSACSFSTTRLLNVANFNPPALNAGPNRLSQVLHMLWHSPESGGLWYKSIQFVVKLKGTRVSASTHGVGGGQRRAWCSERARRALVRQQRDAPIKSPRLSLQQPRTNPAPYTLHPEPCTLHPTPYTLHPTPCTLQLTPTLHPTLCTLPPYTLHLAS